MTTWAVGFLDKCVPEIQSEENNVFLFSIPQSRHVQDKKFTAKKNFYH
jgi:hypothetical protein